MTGSESEGGEPYPLPAAPEAWLAAKLSKAPKAGSAPPLPPLAPICQALGMIVAAAHLLPPGLSAAVFVYPRPDGTFTGARILLW